MARTIAGICYVKVDGEQLSLSGNLSISMAEVTREAVMGSLGVAGCSETPVAPTITGTFNVDEKFPIDTLLRNTNMTVTAWSSRCPVLLSRVRSRTRPVKVRCS
jgi:hypothetical protein